MITKIYGWRGTPIRARTKTELERFLDGLDLLEPGVVTCSRWRPDPASDEPESTCSAASPASVELGVSTPVSRTAPAGPLPNPTSPSAGRPRAFPYAEGPAHGTQMLTIDIWAIPSPESVPPGSPPA